MPYWSCFFLHPCRRSRHSSGFPAPQSGRTTIVRRDTRCVRRHIRHTAPLPSQKQLARNSRMLFHARPYHRHAGGRSPVPRIASGESSRGVLFSDRHGNRSFLLRPAAFGIFVFCRSVPEKRSLSSVFAESRKTYPPAALIVWQNRQSFDRIFRLFVRTDRFTDFIIFYYRRIINGLSVYFVGFFAPIGSVGSNRRFIRKMLDESCR